MVNKEHVNKSMNFRAGFVIIYWHLVISLLVPITCYLLLMEKLFNKHGLCVLRIYLRKAGGLVLALVETFFKAASCLLAEAKKKSINFKGRLVFGACSAWNLAEAVEMTSTNKYNSLLRTARWQESGCSKFTTGCTCSPPLLLHGIECGHSSEY